MKKYFKMILLFAILIIASLYFQNKGKTETLNEDKKVLGLPSENGNNLVSFTLGEKTINVSWIEVSDAQSLSLIPNFTEKLTAQEALTKYACIALTSAGFYTKQNSPIGLFTYERKQIKKTIVSSTFNGFFSLNDFYTPRITRQLPDDSLRMALQSGPLIKENGQILTLKMKNDAAERRIVIGVTGGNKAYLLVFYDPQSVFMGPKFADLGKAVSLFEEETGIVFADVLNLDGGTASLFYSDSLQLPEAVISGSFFCLK